MFVTVHPDFDPQYEIMTDYHNLELCLDNRIAASSIESEDFTVFDFARYCRPLLPA